MMALYMGERTGTPGPRLVFRAPFPGPVPPGMIRGGIQFTSDPYEDWHVYDGLTPNTPCEIGWDGSELVCSFTHPVTKLGVVMPISFTEEQRARHARSPDAPDGFYPITFGPMTYREPREP